MDGRLIFVSLLVDLRSPWTEEVAVWLSRPKYNTMRPSLVRDCWSLSWAEWEALRPSFAEMECLRLLG